MKRTFIVFRPQQFICDISIADGRMCGISHISFFILFMFERYNRVRGTVSLLVLALLFHMRGGRRKIRVRSVNQKCQSKSIFYSVYFGHTHTHSHAKCAASVVSDSIIRKTKKK